MAIIRLVPDLLTILAQNNSAFEEEMAVATTAIARFFLRLLLALGLRVDNSTSHISGRALTMISLFVG
jgi:hypothetical protein